MTYTYVLSRVQDAIAITVVGDGECIWGASLECNATEKIKWATGVTLASFGVYWLLFVFYSFWTWRQLHGRLYQDFRLSHLILRLQVR